MPEPACRRADPRTSTAAPKTRFISTFIGDANVLPGRRQGGRVTLDAGASFPDAGADEAIVVVVRPEAIALGRDRAAGPAGAIRLTGRLSDSVFLGPYVKYRVTLENGAEVVVHSQDVRLRHELVLGEPVQLSWGLAQQRVLVS